MLKSFEYLIAIRPLGMMYGSKGAFLSPENLVGRSGTKFPPDASTLSGLIFSANKISKTYTQEELRHELVVAGPFWADCEDKQDFYVPIPWHQIISEHGVDTWVIRNGQWYRENAAKKLEPDYQWQKIGAWGKPARVIKSNQSAAKSPWKSVSFLHPQMEVNQRCVKNSGGLFLESAVQLPEEYCLVYLATYPIEAGWYRFGGENHIVEIECEKITRKKILELFEQPIERAFALIVPGVWGSTRFSHRYPLEFEETFGTPLLLTDKPIPYRYRATGRLGRGRYAVPAGSVYVLNKPIGKSWRNWDETWFPNEGYSLQKVGCGLCLPVNIDGVE
ncbi:MAG: CRISPR-associated protein [Fischerella sp.]|jgi:CRISPR-associated protein Cmr3|uniref:CRISPR-associated protein Cmr3 n=1 Tax=unclassified Fischerella TaxID=494603 RepID=UPI0004B9557D|nr:MULTISPECIES: CRISPR-associated protein Cmr3 [unclassified Fischerella]NWF62430.1 CRISPR-associated protein [Fischerella sp.]